MSRAKPYFQKVGARLRDTLLFPAMSTPLAQNRCSRRHVQLLKYLPFKIQYLHFVRCHEFKTGIKSLQQNDDSIAPFQLFLRSIVHMRWCAPSRTLYFTGFLKNVFFGLYGWILKYSWGGLGMSLGPHSHLYFEGLMWYFRTEGFQFLKLSFKL